MQLRMTPLMIAARHGEIHAVSELICLGANVNIQSYVSPLFFEAFVILLDFEAFVSLLAFMTIIIQGILNNLHTQ